MTKSTWDWPRFVGFFIGFAVLLAVVFSAFYTIDAGERGVLLTFGKADPDAKEEGLHLKWPLGIQSVVRLETRTRKYEATATAASQDLQDVTTHVAVNYHITPDAAPAIYTTLGVTYEDRIIQPVVQEVVKAVTADFKAEALITTRPLVKDRIVDRLRTRLTPHALIVEDISITNFAFSPSFTEAIEAKVTAAQLKQKADNDLERIKVEALQAEAAAIGLQKANIAKATGEAQAISIIDKTLRSSPQYLHWLTVQKWDGVLPLATGGAMPLLTLPSTAPAGQDFGAPLGIPRSAPANTSAAPEAE